MKPRTGTDERSRKQTNCTKMVGAQFSVDERVFTVLKYTETGNVLETIRSFQRAVSESEDAVQANNNGQ